MSGIEVALALRKDSSTAHIPIIIHIILTAKGQEFDKARGDAAGAFAYLIKPFSPLELLERVQEALQSAGRVPE